MGGRYVAFPDVCLHYRIPLSQGRLNGDVLTCRWHQWQYNLRTGAVHSDESPYCSFITFPVTDVDGRLMMDPHPVTTMTSAKP